jgi:hypothetical protein
LNLFCRTSKLEWSAVDVEEGAGGTTSVGGAAAACEMARIKPVSKYNAKRYDFPITFLAPSFTVNPYGS